MSTLTSLLLSLLSAQYHSPDKSTARNGDGAINDKLSFSLSISHGGMADIRVKKKKKKKRKKKDLEGREDIESENLREKQFLHYSFHTLYTL